jgi:putative methyltransferase
MQENLKQHHVQNVELKCLDFLKTDPEKYSQVNYVLLDPSCSGSGMTNRFKYGIEENESVKDEKRLWNLEALQRRMIMHAMSFENVKRIVYSTCSIHEEENENVVRYALQNCKNKFKLVNLFPNKWYYGRGICHNSQDSHEYHLNYCIRTSYEKNFTNGFFIALFERQKEPFDENLILE